MALARTQMVHGQLRAAEAIYSSTLAQAQRRGMGKLPITAQAHVNLGRIYYEWNELEAAAEQLWLGVERMHGQGGSWLQFEVFLLLARLEQARGRPADALALLQRAEQAAQHDSVWLDSGGDGRSHGARSPGAWRNRGCRVPGWRRCGRRWETISTACARRST